QPQGSGRGVPAPAGRDGGQEGGRGGPTDENARVRPPLVPLVPLVAGARAGGRVRRGRVAAAHPTARMAGPFARPLVLARPPDDDSPGVHGSRRRLLVVRGG